MSPRSPADRVQTTETSLTIIETIRDQNGATTSEVAEQLEIATSTAHKHLATLRARGYLIKEGETYHVGLKFLNLGEYARMRWPQIEQITEYVSVLTERTDEECDFVTEDHGRIITIAESYHKWAKYADDDRSVSSKQYRARIGAYYHMHSTASGLAILAEYPDERVAEIVEQWGLPARTDHTITDRKMLFDELARIRDQGYAVDDQGYAEGMRSVGKAVKTPDGSISGALSVSGPTYRIDGSVLEREIPNALLDCVEGLESRLAD